MKTNKRFLFAILIIPSFFVFQTASAATDASSNWAGYVASGATYTSVGASWIVPAATASGGALSADATWVGIGGLSSQDLIQAGTQDVIQNGVPTYQAWYEMLPGSSVRVPLTVHSGDAVTVSLTEQSGNEWQIFFSDTTTGQQYQTLVSYASSLSSAEWIEEMPSDQRGLVSLDNFGTVSFSNGFVVQNGSQTSISGSGAQPMTMITSADQALATPSALGADGASFTVTRSRAVASVSPNAIRVGRWSRTGISVQGYTRPTSFTNPSRSRFRSRFSVQLKQIFYRSNK